MVMGVLHPLCLWCVHHHRHLRLHTPPPVVLTVCLLGFSFRHHSSWMLLFFWQPTVWRVLECNTKNIFPQWSPLTDNCFTMQQKQVREIKGNPSLTDGAPIARLCKFTLQSPWKGMKCMKYVLEGYWARNRPEQSLFSFYCSTFKSLTILFSCNR